MDVAVARPGRKALAAGGGMKRQRAAVEKAMK